MILLIGWEILVKEGYEYSGLTDEFVDGPLYFEGVEIEHGLDGIEVFTNHLDDLLKVIRLTYRGLELIPGSCNDVALQIAPQAVNRQVHSPTRSANSLVELLNILPL